MLFGIVPANATPPVFNGSLNLPPFGVVMGGQTTLTVPGTATIYFLGDSITHGTAGGTTCTAFDTPTQNPTGNCYPDDFTAYYTGATEVNWGINGVCMSHGTTLCTTSNNGIDVYQTDLANAGQANTWIVLAYGHNDAGNSGSDSTLGPVCQTMSVGCISPYERDLNTVLNWLANTKKQNMQQVILLAPPPDASGTTVDQSEFINRSIAMVGLIDAKLSLRYGTRFVDGYSALGTCTPNTPGITNCLYSDGTHPNALGSTFLANALQAQSPLGALASYISDPLYTTLLDNMRLGYGQGIETQGVKVWVDHNGLSFPNDVGGTNAGTTYIHADSTGALLGLSCKQLVVLTTTANLCMDDSSNLGVRGNFLSGGTITGAGIISNGTSSAAFIANRTNNTTQIGYGWETGGTLDWSFYETANNDELHLWQQAHGLDRLVISDSGVWTISGLIVETAHNTCSASSNVPCGGTVTCSISAGTTCSVNATVPASSVCTATSNSSDTTTGVESIKFGALSTNTLPVNFTVASSQTSTAAANITCL